MTPLPLLFSLIKRAPESTDIPVGRGHDRYIPFVSLFPEIGFVVFYRSV